MTVVARSERAASTAARPSGGRAAISGMVAAGTALAVTEVAGAVLSSGPSLIVSVGSRFIDAGAGPLKEVAVDLFGTGDKAALIVGIVLVSLAAGSLLGRASVKRPWIGVAGFAAFAAVGILAGIGTPLTSAWAIVVAAVLGAGAGIVTLRWLLRRAIPSPPPAEPAIEDPRDKATDRRSFLLAAGGVGAAAVVAAAAGRRLRTFRAPAGGPGDVALPLAKTTVPVPATQPFAVEGLSPYITPNADFYRIDTALLLPRIDPGTWQMQIKGMVDRPVTLGLGDLLAMDLVEEPVTIACVSNEVGGDLIGTAVWRGVPLRRLLDMAGVQPGATQIVGRSVDGFTVGFPTEKALDGRPALVAVGMNGDPLPTDHGFPARLVVAGLYGYVSATKWLKEIELTRLEDFDAYWIPRGWAKEAPVKTQSRIDVPRTGAKLPTGPVVLAGVAWAPTRGIDAVEVRVDDGPWQRAELGDVANENTWVQWRHEWAATPGDHLVAVRATDGTGEVQTDERRPPDPDGATGHHQRRITIT